MGQTHSAPKRFCTASAPALAVIALLSAFAGCGVRTDQHLSQSPLPICGDGASHVCPVAEQVATTKAPSWLARCRRGWLHWRHGHGPSEQAEPIVIPPPPRFHPVPNRPVFSPLEFESPAGATLTPPPPDLIPVAPVPMPVVPPEEIPHPEASPTVRPAAPPTPIPPSSDPPVSGQPTASQAPQLLPRTLLPRSSLGLNSASGVPMMAKVIAPTAKIPDSPQATEPLEEPTPSTQWKPRR